MNDTPAWKLGATDMLARYRAGTLTPREALESCLQRIDAVQPAINAFVALRTEAARAEADASGERWRRGAPCGPLDGVPLSIKDNLPTCDMPTTWGCVAMRDYRSGYDELAVARARAAGAVIVGKTNVPEFTLEGYTGNRLFGTTRNPWNTALTPGGSSGGAVAAVAAGCVPLALCTDGGGSIRRPASHAGLVGLKPSIGAIARTVGLPPLLLDFEVVGPVARSVADTALLFDAVRGSDAQDRRSIAAEAAQSIAAAATPASAPRKSLRVLYVPTLDAAPVDPHIALSCRQAAQHLADAGHEVSEGALPLSLAGINAQWPRVSQIGLAALFEQWPHLCAEVSPQYLAMARQAGELSAASLWKLLEAVEQLRRDVTTLFTQYDVIVMPSAAALPWQADAPFPLAIDGQAVGPRGHAVFTGWVNAAGLPALAVPAAPAPDGLPIGIQLIGGYGTDNALLALGAAYEAIAPWSARRPAL